MEAPPEIAGAIRYANRHQLADVMIVGRGGGSLEDLWAFNDERVARAIYASEIPVISAVGHEPDVAISDFVADRRASTPSNAAEIAVPDRAELLHRIESSRQRLERALCRRVENQRERLETLAKKRVLQDPAALLSDKAMRLDYGQRRLAAAMQTVTDREKGRLAAAAASLDALSPLRVLGRGYALAQTAKGDVLRSVSQVEAGEKVKLRLSEGRLTCVVTEKERQHGDKKDV